MNKKERQQKKEGLKDQLDKQMGNIRLACRKIGISRNTYYRWKKEDEEWGKKMDEIKEEKDEEMNDYAEGKLYEHIKDDNIASLIFYLKTRHPSYGQKLKLEGEIKHNLKLSKDEKELLNRAIKIASSSGEDTE